MQVAFEVIGLSFAKSRVASLFMRKMATDPARLLAGGAQERFAGLLRSLSDAVERIASSERGPFSSVSASSASSPTARALVKERSD